MRGHHTYNGVPPTGKIREGSLKDVCLGEGGGD